MGSITVKISKEAIMSINSPKRLFNDKLKTKVYIAGLPDRNESLIKPVRIQTHTLRVTAAAVSMVENMV